MIFQRLILFLSPLLNGAACSKSSSSNNHEAPSVTSLLNSGLEAIGGVDAVEAITGVTYQSPSYAATLLNSYFSH